MPVDPFDAVILAGGAARRLGGADKPGLAVGGRPLVERVVAAASGARRTVVVGPRRDLPGVLFTREDPPGGGPVPALAAGLREVDAPWLVLLAGDLPFLTAAHVRELLAAARPGAGAVMVDDEGREQWLVGAWPVPELRASLDAYAGRSLKGLLGPLTGTRLASPGRPWFDCDTMDDLKEARMNVLTEWTALVCGELGVDPARVDRDLVLDLTKEVAHGVARPAAPLTAYLLGLAQGAGTAPEDAVAKLITLAKNWERATTETLTDG
ncbi:NTP transferase domain-containing protein [Nonomuraea sp. NPDC049607]|uniref:NTP transferase domain-containing protein n=1 Tax=Nonomuraea sp. NPDC049607 TaxID=3154732 RepID=UPI0034278724